MHITAICPILSANYGEEVRKESARWVPPGVALSVRQVRHGVETIEGAYDHVRSAPAVLEQVETAVAEGTDGVFVSCFTDPAVAAARERVDVPIVGGFEPAMLTALSLGERIGIVTSLPNVVPVLRGAIREHGLSERCSVIEVVDIPVLDLLDRRLMVERLHDRARAIVEADAADVIVLGCTAMSGAAEEVGHQLAAAGIGVPVLDPTATAIGWLLHLARLGVTSSRRTYFPPPDKVRVKALGGERR